MASTAGLYPIFFNCKTVLLINELLPDPAGPVIPIITDLPEFLNIFLTKSRDLLCSFYIREIVFAIAPLLPFFKSARRVNNACLD